MKDKIPKSVVLKEFCEKYSMRYLPEYAQDSGKLMMRIEHTVLTAGNKAQPTTNELAEFFTIVYGEQSCQQRGGVYSNVIRLRRTIQASNSSRHPFWSNVCKLMSLSSKD